MEERNQENKGNDKHRQLGEEEAFLISNFLCDCQYLGSSLSWPEILTCYYAMRQPSSEEEEEQSKQNQTKAMSNTTKNENEDMLQHCSFCLLSPLFSALRFKPRDRKLISSRDYSSSSTSETLATQHFSYLLSNLSWSLPSSMLSASNLFSEQL